MENNYRFFDNIYYHPHSYDYYRSSLKPTCSGYLDEERTQCEETCKDDVLWIEENDEKLYFCDEIHLLFYLSAHYGSVATNGKNTNQTKAKKKEVGYCFDLSPSFS